MENRVLGGEFFQRWGKTVAGSERRHVAILRGSPFDSHDQWGFARARARAALSVRDDHVKFLAIGETIKLRVSGETYKTRRFFEGNLRNAEERLKPVPQPGDDGDVKVAKTRKGFGGRRGKSREREQRRIEERPKGPPTAPEEAKRVASNERRDVGTGVRR